MLSVVAKWWNRDPEKYLLWTRALPQREPAEAVHTRRKFHKVHKQRRCVDVPHEQLCRRLGELWALRAVLHMEEDVGLIHKAPQRGDRQARERVVHTGNRQQDRIEDARHRPFSLSARRHQAFVEGAEEGGVARGVRRKAVGREVRVGLHSDDREAVCSGCPGVHDDAALLDGKGAGPLVLCEAGSSSSVHPATQTDVS